ncbi:ATP-grasp domain-containing protein [Mycolicibacterium peregrinum]|uniref:ATP-grasp domain-containing protein n=1 Tax=Mycolicibacterium peregrinum TaxID=43304 RepID=UPI003AAE8B02
MKLARPDVFHPRIVLAGCAALPDGDGDDAGLVTALRNRGLHARWLSWDDPATLDADLVILRATWDYTERLEEFLSWTRSVRHLINPPGVVAWNTDKRYLDDLHSMGIPVVPTGYFAVGEQVVVPDGEVVVKPAVGAGSAGAQRFVDASAALAHAAALHATGRAVLVQPYDHRIADGETALVFLGGKESHAFTKGPILPPAGQSPAFEETGTYAEELLSPADPDDKVWRVGRLAIDAVIRSFYLQPEELVYARVDVIGGPEDPRVLELELVEPGLGFRQLDQAAREDAERRFAVGVEGALERFGLGPLSHRGF